MRELRYVDEGKKEGSEEKEHARDTRNTQEEKKGERLVTAERKGRWEKVGSTVKATGADV